MVPQQDTGVKPPDGAAHTKVAKQKGGPLGGTHPAAATNGAAAVEAQQAQRCPRCDSLNTKFCYYNNYSLSQPRHFCKNCRRYWTKGGALRNVPVGGGCRKNKRLKHRDPSCLASLADMDASGPSSILSSMGIPGFAPSTSSLIQELANEGHRLAFSRLGMQRFMTDNDHHQQHPPTSTTQDLFTLGGSPPALGAFDQSFPGLTYSKGDSQPLMFHPHHASDQFTPSFFDSINSPSALTPTLDHLSSFTAATPTAAHHASVTSLSNTASIDAGQISMIHHMPMNGMQVSHEQQQAIQASSGGGGSFNQEEESAEMSLRRSKGKSIVSSLSEWGQQLQGLAPAGANATSNGADHGCFFVPPQLGAATDNGLWNVSWPEMHAALAGSAGAMLH